LRHLVIKNRYKSIFLPFENYVGDYHYRNLGGNVFIMTQLCEW
jgi:hypothetical protein